MERLLEEVRQGNLQARAELVRVLEQDERVKRTIHSLAYERNILEQDDVRGEFWLGVAKRMGVIRHDLGDPVLHLIEAGTWQVKSVIRTELHRKIVQRCHVCSHVNARYNFGRLCDRCGQTVENEDRLISDQDVDTQNLHMDEAPQDSVLVIRCRASQMQLLVLETIINLCIQGSENPISDCATLLNVSRQRIHQHLQRLRPAIELD